MIHEFLLLLFHASKDTSVLLRMVGGIGTFLGGSNVVYVSSSKLNNSYG